MNDSTLSLLERIVGGTAAPTLLNMALLVALALVAAQLTWHVVPIERPATTASSRPAQGNAAAARAVSSDATRIAEQHLFGSVTRTATVTPTRTEEAPDTKLNLELLGVLAYDPEASALAIISEAGRNEKVYAVGDKLPGNATLEQVFADRIILKRGGRLETLRLPEKSTPITVARAKSAQPIEALSAVELRDRIVKNPMEFARKVRTIPYKQDGKLIGYRLRATDYEGVLAQYGMQPNDVVTEVNGTRLNEQKKSLRALRSLSTAKSLDVKILRDGAEIPLFISLE